MVMILDVFIDSVFPNKSFEKYLTIFCITDQFVPTTETFVPSVVGAHVHPTPSIQYRVFPIHTPVSLTLNMTVCVPELTVVLTLSSVRGAALSMIKYPVV